jgi:hypothetical protein
MVSIEKVEMKREVVAVNRVRINNWSKLQSC